jgi:hypothetical protein
LHWRKRAFTHWEDIAMWKKYKLKENSKQDIEMGQFAYLLFEGETDNEGRFEIFFLSLL